MDEFINTLNPQQKEVVLTTNGPLLIIAGPGSGKTKTLTYRIAYLIKNGTPPENILAVTFTNKAAEEMKIRIQQIVQGLKISTAGQFKDRTRKSWRGLFIGTFHSLAAKILRSHAAQAGYLENFTIYDEDDSLNLIKEIMKELGINPKKFSPGAIASTISRLKSELITPAEYASQQNHVSPFFKIVQRIYEEYQKRLNRANAMDFDDLLTNVCALFEKNQNLLVAYQNLFYYINVDEWQDTNIAQYTLITQLARLHRNIAVVGDDAQAIYGWRNADYRNIFNFERDFPDAKIIILEQNYRSTRTILDAAQSIIAHNVTQKEKRLWTERKAGEPIEITIAANEKKEAESVANIVEKLLKHGYRLKDLAVLYRTNAQSRVLEEVMLERNFPYKIVGGVKFYQRKEIKDILAYLRYLINPRDMISLKRIINTPARGIGKQTFLKYLAGDLKKNRGGESLQNFDRLMASLREEMKEQTASFFVKNLLKKINYQEYLEECFLNYEERLENIDEFVNLAARYNDLIPPAGIEKLLEEAALISEADQVDTEGDMINLMTIHAAKGLEFPIIFITGMEEGIFPHSKTIFNPAELEEERRLCYVGITRAKDKVYLSLALNRIHFGSKATNPPSRFLGEIPEHLIRLNETEEKIIEI